MKDTPDIDLTIYTDAINEGWGASDGLNPAINGRWSNDELSFHINVKELLAIKFAILAIYSLY